MKNILTTLLIALVLIINAPKAEASGVPTIDVVAIATNLLNKLIQEDELAELVETYNRVKEQYDFLLARHEEWRLIANTIEVVNAQENVEFIKILEAVELTDGVTKDLETPVIIPEVVWGNDFPPARNSYVKRQEFIHQNIKKLNGLWDEHHKRAVKLKELITAFDELETPKAMQTKISAILVELNRQSNDEALIQQISSQINLGLKALELEELGAEILELKDATEVR